MTFSIGRKATEQDTRGGGNGEVWIKGFKAGDTRIRIVQPTKDWHFYYEHYKGGVGYFGCTEQADCLGCTDEDPKVAQRNKRYGFNAIDESGRLSVFKVGPSVYKVMKSREQRLDTVMDRDYTIVKSGAGLDTLYEVEPGDRYPVDIPAELHDIESILVQKIINEVLPAYGSEIIDRAEAESAPVLEKEVPTNGTGQEVHPDFEEMSTADIREWLGKHGVEFADREPRTKLIKKALDTPLF